MGLGGELGQGHVPQPRDTGLDAARGAPGAEGRALSLPKHLLAITWPLNGSAHSL